MGKTWPEGQGVESGLEPSPAAIATIPVSSTTVASTSFLASPNFDVISRSSLNPTTFTKTFTCLDAGVRSFTFVIVFSSMLSLLPTQAAESQRVGKNLPPGEFRRCGLTVLTNRCYKNIRKRRRINRAAHVRPVSTLSWRPRVRKRHQLFSATLGFHAHPCL